MNCINCGTELPELVNGASACPKCKTVIKSHAVRNTGTLLTVFQLGNDDNPVTYSQFKAFIDTLRSFAMKEGNNYLAWKYPLTIEQFDAYPDRETELG